MAGRLILKPLAMSSTDFVYRDDLLSRAVQDVERIRFLTGRATVRLTDGTEKMIQFQRLAPLPTRSTAAAQGRVP